MEEVGEGVDDGSVSPLGKLLDDFLPVGPDDDSVQVAGEDAGGVGDAFSTSDLGTMLVEDEGVGTEFV